jgi:hypothetical protein
MSAYSSLSNKPLDPAPAPETANSNDDSSDADDVTATLSSPSISKQKPPVRGKRGKAKKIKAKYSDQSDEERDLARKLLGGKTPTEPKPTSPEPPQPIKKPAPLPPPRPPQPPVDEPLEVRIPAFFFSLANSGGRTSISRSRNSSPRRNQEM